LLVTVPTLVVAARASALMWQAPHHPSSREGQKTMKVGFIGLGDQGAPIARRIVEGGFGLTLWARRPESLAPFGDTAATHAATPAELGEASDLVGVCVYSDADVLDVVLRPDGVLAGMTEGGIIAVHSTVLPTTVVQVAEAAAARGVAVVDAPVSGGRAVAEAGQLLVMAGGEEAVIDRCRPVFATFADPIVHLGPLGSGSVAKAINNMVLAANLTMALDVFDFADELGLDKAGLAEALTHGSGSTRAIGIVAQTGFSRAFMLQNSGTYFHKDLEVMRGIAGAAGAHQPDALVELAGRMAVAPDESVS
jgi:3-hydroxyisobutyrate dehydrogenase-like beta-hydroxyacid dehydrogenase